MFIRSWPLILSSINPDRWNLNQNRRELYFSNPRNPHSPTPQIALFFADEAKCSSMRRRLFGFPEQQIKATPLQGNAVNSTALPKVWQSKKDASTALYSLCSTKENKIRAFKAGIVRAILDLMSDPDSGMVDKAAYVLYAVIGLPEGRASAVQEDAIPVLVEIVEIGMPRLKEIAASSLLLIFEESVHCCAMAVREAALPPFTAFSQSASSRAKQKVHFR